VGSLFIGYDICRSLCRTLVIALAFAIATQVATSGETSECSDIMMDSSHHAAQVIRMSHLASLVEWSFHGEDSPTLCDVKDSNGQQIVNLDDVRKTDGIADIIESGAFPIIFEYEHYAASLQSTDKAEKTQYHVSCHRNIPDIELAIRIDLYENIVLPSYDAGDGIVPMNTSHASIEVDVLIPESMMGSVNEQIEVAEAQFVHSNNPNAHQEKVFLIRGTDLDFDHLAPRIGTSIHAALGDACAIRAAAIIVQILSVRGAIRDNTRVFTVAGSSLGGTATQHVALDQQTRPDA
jgi:hypothetical protein